jgi:FMN phosphatase YigB (HAD superfamily)
MKKKIYGAIVLCSALVCLFYYHDSLFATKVLSAEQQKHLLNTIDKPRFLWDLHDVIFYARKSDFLTMFWNFDQWLTCIRHLDQTTLKTIGKFVLHKMHLNSQSVGSEELISVAKNSHNDALEDLVVRYNNAYQPSEEMVAMINFLANSGYQHDLGSNIGEYCYKSLQEKYPFLYNMFSITHVIHYENNVLSPKKPNPAYFTTYLEQNHLKPGNVIFIDDRPENVAAAQSVGIIGLLFKSPEQLWHDLQSLSIVPPEQVLPQHAALH